MTQKAEPRLSYAALRILRVLVDQPSNLGLAGADIARVTGILSGTLYPVLARLTQAGWLTKHWENLDPREAGRPRRCLYHLTVVGTRLATTALSKLARSSAGELHD